MLMTANYKFRIRLIVSVIFYWKLRPTNTGELEIYCKEVKGLWFTPAGSCLRYYHQLLTWAEANDRCVKEKTPLCIAGRLAVVPSKEAYDWLCSAGPGYNFSKTHKSWFGLKTRRKNVYTVNKEDWAFMVGEKVVANWTYKPTGQRQCPGYEERCQVRLCMSMGTNPGRIHVMEPCTEKSHAICEFLIDPDGCCSSPCKNDGTCLFTGGTAFKCQCAPGFEGLTCEKAIDACESNPCQNGGACMPKANGFVCYCGPGYTGVKCETQTNVNECSSSPCKNGGACKDNINGYTCDVDECNSNPCQHGGTCKDKASSYTCECVDGFSGKLCEIDNDECVSTPCRNNATCTDQVNSYICHCATGFTGRICQRYIDECLSHPCQNGTCRDGINGFKCQCVDGFTGDVCQTNIDECNSNPCENGGACTDKVNSYVCQCTPGFAGVMCQRNIDECNSNPCDNGGTCNDGINEFTCNCTAGYTGDMCRTNIDECHSNPCLFGGTCIDGIDKYTCLCEAGFTGKLCDAFSDIPPNLEEDFYDAGIDESVLADEASVSASLQDTLPFMLDSLSEEKKWLMGYTFDEMVPFCTFNGLDCNKKDFKEIYDPLLGNCFVFNYEVPPTYKTHRAGADSQTAGFRILIHNSTQHPFPDAEGYNIPPGTSVTMSFTSHQINRLGPPTGSCQRQHDFNNYYFNGTFTVEGCLRSCFQNILMENCGCGDPRIPLPDGMTACGLPTKTCLDYYRACQNDYVDLSKCSCHNPCEEFIFDAVLSTAKLKNKNLLERICRSFHEKSSRTYDDTDFKDIGNETYQCLKSQKRNFAMVRIFYEKLNHRVFVETESYTLYQLASDFGGMMGIILGLSVISILEFLYTSVALLIYCISAKRVNIDTIFPQSRKNRKLPTNKHTL